MAAHNSSARGSNAWTREEDDVLLELRRKGVNWKGVQENFPNKTPNACRKHHERLVESRKNAEDWPPEKMELLAKEYLAHRKEIWTMLAAPTGEKWATAEAKCMDKGLKSLVSVGRSALKRDNPDKSGNNDSALGGSEAEMDLDEASPTVTELSSPADDEPQAKRCRLVENVHPGGPRRYASPSDVPERGA